MTSTFQKPAKSRPSAVTRGAILGLMLLLTTSTSIRADEPAASDYQPFDLRSARAEEVALELQKSLQGKAQVLIDRQGNRVLVRGTQQYLQIADHLIRQLDNAAASSVKRTYPVPAESIERVANQLRYRYANTETVRVSVDALASGIEVTAPLETHRDIASLLGGLGGVPDAGTQPVVHTNEATLNRTHQLSFASADAVLDKLKSIWGSALQLQALGRGEGVRVRLQSERAPQTLVEFDLQRNVVRLEGPKSNVASWQILLQSLDQPEELRAGKTQLVRARQSDSEAIQKAISMAQELSKREGSSSDILDLISRKSGPGWGGRLVSLIFQPKEDTTQEPGPDDAGAPPADVPPAVAGRGADSAGGGLLGTVQIEFLDGLDMMIIRGHPEDVARVTRLIEQIQNDAIGTEPDVQIVPLRHVNSRAIYGVLNDLYQQVYAPRQGPVSITPLVKPNALLLVGRPENNQSVVSLLRQLDVPVPPSTEIEVLYLKHMSAVDAVQRINDFYNTQAPSPNPQDTTELIRGLSARVRVTADYRSNAVIVQASPRDMEEVREFVRKIDIPSNKSLHEVKIIPLKNALAADLAPVLQDAINGQLQGAGRATTSATQQQQQLQTTATPAQIRSTILEFVGIDRNGAQSRVRSGITFDVRVVADQNRNALIVIGPPNSMPLLEALINELDQLPSASAQIKVFTIVNGDATNLTIMLQQLFGQDVTAGTGSFGQAATLRAAFQPAAATAGGEGSLVPVRFAVDQRTNSIVSSGSESDLAVVEAILARLDEDGIETRRTTVYRLQNAPALDVATAITDVLTRQQQASLSALTGVLSPAEQFEREVFIVPEAVSNSLIISSTPRYFDNVVQIIKDLDQRPPMVMIQVLIAEVSYGDAFEFGFETGFQDSLVFSRGIDGGPRFPFNQSLLGNDNTGTSLATRENLAGQVLSNLAVGRTSGLGLGYGGLILTAGNESVNFLLRALQNNKAAQILARPQIMTLDNQVAFVQIGARVARVLGGSTTPQGGTTQNVTDVDVGVILRVQPRISPDGTVVMLLDTERSEVSATEGTTVGFSAEGEPLVSPNINTTTAQTTLSARSGQTVVFAGLMQKVKSFERRSLPWFGNLPGIGWLFGYDQEQETRRELLIIMTPYIIKDDEDYEWLNRTEMERMSWCLSDIVQMHGNLGAGITPAYWDGSAPSVVYPELDPTGSENIQPPEIQLRNAPRPLDSSSRRTQNQPTPLQSALDAPNRTEPVGVGPFDERQLRSTPYQGQHNYPEPVDQPASYVPQVPQSGWSYSVDSQENRARQIPSTEPVDAYDGGAFIPSYLPPDSNRSDSGNQLP